MSENTEQQDSYRVQPQSWNSEAPYIVQEYIEEEDRWIKILDALNFKEAQEYIDSLRGL